MNLLFIIFFGNEMPQKAERRIIRVGESSYGVVLPIGWLRYHELKNGDKVQVISNGNVEIKPLDEGN
jgi:bifunctional DNA-binding transcriptional regulator/antitoxin component of YhaV-PrlF toxin-antitoxin module